MLIFDVRILQINRNINIKQKVHAQTSYRYFREISSFDIALTVKKQQHFLSKHMILGYDEIVDPPSDLSISEFINIKRNIK